MKCDSLSKCSHEIVGGIFEYNPGEFGLLEGLFAFTIIIILLNVVIAIVGEAWESAESESNRLFWKYRLEKIFELRYALKLQNCLSTPFKRFKFSCTNVLEKIDEMKDISYGSDVSWNRAPYNVLTKKDQYDNPSKYFSSDQVKIIYDAHSLHADMYWSEFGADRAEPIKDRVFFRKVIILLKWVRACMLYALLIVLGIPAFGILWPKKFRAGLLTLGFRNQEMESNADDVSRKKNDKMKVMNDEMKAVKAVKDGMVVKEDIDGMKESIHAMMELIKDKRD